MPAIALLAPTEATMGNAQRIVYIHVPVAWLGLLGLLLMAGTGVMYLCTRNLSWDQWSQAAAELGWLCCGLTLADRLAVGPRGMGNLVDLGSATHLGLHPVDDLFGLPDPAGAVDDPHRRGRLSAVFAVIGALDVPLVIVAAHWFRGIHPSTRGHGAGDAHGCCG